METLNFTEKRFQISLAYIEEVLKEKSFSKNDCNSFTNKNKGTTLFVNKLTNDSVNNNLILILILVNELGQIQFSNTAIIKSDSNIESNFSNIDIALKTLEPSI